MRFNKSLLAAALVLAAASQAQADIVSYSFGGIIEEGPLLGASFSGTFSFDDATLTAATDWLPLSALSFSFNSESYTLASAVGGSTAVTFAAGVPVGLDGVWQAGGGYELILTNGFGSPYLADSNNNAGSLTISAMPVPEPATWALGLAGLAVVGAIARRRRNA